MALRDPSMPYHPSTAAILRHFEFGHLPADLQDFSGACHELAHTMADRLEGAELTAGLRKLLEAKDCFVRAALEGPRQRSNVP